MLEEVQKVKNYISIKQVLYLIIYLFQVAMKINLTLKELQECQNTLKGVMMIAYPGYHGVEDWEPAR